MFDVHASLKSNDEFDQNHNRFSKFVLGIQSQASNFTVQSELDQFPLIITIITSSVNFRL